MQPSLGVSQLIESTHSGVRFSDFGGTGIRPPDCGYTPVMTIVIILVLLLMFGVLGAVLKGLLWLAGIAVLLLAGAAAFGWWKFRRR